MIYTDTYNKRFLVSRKTMQIVPICIAANVIISYYLFTLRTKMAPFVIAMYLSVVTVY